MGRVEIGILIITKRRPLIDDKRKGHGEKKKEHKSCENDFFFLFFLYLDPLCQNEGRGKEAKRKGMNIPSE